MKVRVSMPGAVVSMEMEDVQAVKTFKELACRLIGMEVAGVVKMQPKVKILSEKFETAPEANKKEVQKLFDHTIDDYLKAQGITGDTDTPEVDPPDSECSMKEPVETGPAEPEPAETEPAEPEPAETEPAEPEPDAMPAKKYKGFLYIQCEECKTARGFCAKEPISVNRCKCGYETKLMDLVPLYVHCECGKRFKYMTNMDEFLFDMNCMVCGSPVPVKWNRNKRLYETIQ